jgi:tetratricopeptide (TPR) repeat protein
MTVSLQTPSSLPVKGTPVAEVADRPGLMRRVLLITLGVLLVFAATYVYAWFNAYRLSARFTRDADESFEQGNYLKALVGYEDFDPLTNRYTNRGGYVKVERIWSHAYSWPLPPLLQNARQHTTEIINQQLTIADAEDYIRANTGRSALYFAEIYLRLGELYEADGDKRSASEIYQDVIELFPNRSDLTALAQDHLAQLEAQP